MADSLIFYLLGAVILASAAGVVFLKNVVHAGFLLVLTFAGVGGLYLLLNADFVAMAQILIYVGAITIMILFALMLTQRQDSASEPPHEGRSFWAGLTALLLGVVLYRSIVSSPWGLQARYATGALTRNTLFTLANGVQQAYSAGSALILGNGFFGEFLLPFEVASLLLLMALVGAIVLAKKEPEPAEVREVTVLTARPELAAESAGSPSAAELATIEEARS